jgi:hypothetical protein
MAGPGFRDVAELNISAGMTNERGTHHALPRISIDHGRHAMRTDR